MAAFAENARGHQQNAAVPFAQTLLDLFGPAPLHRARSHDMGSTDQRALWAADALHRANNLAQMASSLGSPGLRHLHGPQADDRGAHARALSRAYAELGTSDATDRAIPCAPLLEAIATRLVALFGAERSIRLHVAVGHVVLPAEQRRALTLIASELIINSLKYAFPAATAGLISITLGRWTDKIELSVADNGSGLTGEKAESGTGTTLMWKLAAMLGGELRRFSSDSGLRVVLSMPCPAACP